MPQAAGSAGPKGQTDRRRSRRRASAIAAGAGLVLALGATAAGVRPALAQTRHHPVNLSLFYPLSTNRSLDVSTGLRVNLIYGRLAAVRGLDLGSGVSVLDRGLSGVQFTGIYSHLKGDFRGAQLAGGGNFTRGGGQGLQCAGVFNYDRGEVVGLQSAGLLNYAETGFHGVQLAGVLNLSDGPGGFLQLSGVANTDAGRFRGAQLAGFFNFASHEVAGAQVAALNYGETVTGLQLGLVNFAGRAQGLQLGLVNYARQQDGLPVGAVNVAGNGRTGWVAFAGNLMGANLGVRTSVSGFYSMLTLGGWDLQGTRHEAVSLTWNYGRTFPLGRRLDLDADLGFVHIMPTRSDDPAENDALHGAVQARALLAHAVSPRLAVFAGGGVSVVFDGYTSAATSEVEPLFVAGFSGF